MAPITTSTTTDNSTNQGAPTTTSSLLLCEALGFSPQLLLDDIINISNNAVQDGVNGMEEFLVKWVEDREERHAKKPKEPEPPAKGKKGKKKTVLNARLSAIFSIKAQAKEPEDMTQEIEQGLVSFQTLLEYHTDVAFDFFEAWSLRNVFMIPPELENGGVIVLPHYEGADLTVTPTGGSSKLEEKERDLVDEIEELRKRLDEQRRLTRMFTSALARSRAAKQRADTRLAKLVSALPISPSSDGSTPKAPLDHLIALPQQLLKLYEQTSSLPPLEPWLLQPPQPANSQDSSGGPLTLTGTGKREWEVGSSGYANWAVNRLLSGAKPSDGKNGGMKEEASASAMWVDQMEQVTAYVGSARDVKGALDAFESMQVPAHKPGEESMDVEN
ncbi:hypothetical protein D9611_010153 [Ephemerocybe angulata]|uniref:Uncharacterized protein n=1 Tax=Ephemerocybe angulata TaxID=980116 RepID=A0A8H5EV90_9AGAR|nr:hypothetical protein D9611_010153 [Tulosesus angulatus]